MNMTSNEHFPTSSLPREPGSMQTSDQLGYQLPSPARQLPTFPRLRNESPNFNAAQVTDSGWRQFQSAAAAVKNSPNFHAKLLALQQGNESLDMQNSMRRKNASRETTCMLKAWLHEHRKNPYPTKGEKVMLAIITKMTLTQVSTWFANARRRLKKENKMTWAPRNQSDEEDLDDCLADSESMCGESSHTNMSFQPSSNCLESAALPPSSRVWSIAEAAHREAATEWSSASSASPQTCSFERPGSSGQDANENAAIFIRQTLLSTAARAEASPRSSAMCALAVAAAQLARNIGSGQQPAQFTLIPPPVLNFSASANTPTVPSLFPRAQ